MKYLKMLGLAAIAVMAFLALASSASATQLEVEEYAVEEAVNIEASLASGTSAILSRTDGSLANTCTASSVAGDTESPFTGTTVTGAVDSLSFSSCERTVTVHKAGTLHVEHIASTTNGTVSSSGAEVTVGSPFGTLNCKTGAGVDIGTLTGKASGNAVMDINAVLNCGFLVPSAKWSGTYTVTGPAGLGVVAPAANPPNHVLDYKENFKEGEKLEFTLTDEGSPAAYTVEKATLKEIAGTWKLEAAGCVNKAMNAKEPAGTVVCKPKVECIKKGEADLSFDVNVGGVKFKSRAVRLKCA